MRERRKSEILPNSAIALSPPCSNFLSEEIEKSLSLPSYFNACQRCLGYKKEKKKKGEKEREIERHAKKRSAQIKPMKLETPNAITHDDTLTNHHQNLPVSF